MTYYDLHKTYFHNYEPCCVCECIGRINLHSQEAHRDNYTSCKTCQAEYQEYLNNEALQKRLAGDEYNGVYTMNIHAMIRIAEVAFSKGDMTEAEFESCIDTLKGQKNHNAYLDERKRLEAGKEQIEKTSSYRYPF